MFLKMKTTDEFKKLKVTVSKSNIPLSNFRTQFKAKAVHNSIELDSFVHP